jgi:D-lactate dehydrogenase (cytochrome)
MTNLDEGLLDELRSIAGANLSTAAAVREHHSRGESHHPAALPHAVVFPETTQDVQAIVRACAARRVPVVPFGAGSSLEGHVNPTQGGVSIDMTRMNQILRVSAEDLDATVQAGVTRKAPA